MHLLLGYGDISYISDVAKKNTANIILYLHKSGAHYVALRWDGTNFIGYNTYSSSVGPDNLGNSISSFVSANNRVSVVLVSIS